MAPPRPKGAGQDHPPRTLRFQPGSLQSHQFDGFRPHIEPPVRAVFSEWIPRVTDGLDQHLRFWRLFMGPEWPTTADTARQIQLFDQLERRGITRFVGDVRILGAMAGLKVAFDKPGPISASYELMTRAVDHGSKLKVLHLRVSVQADVIDLAERILSESSRLVDIVIEGDTPPNLHGLKRPTLNFNRIFREIQPERMIERFIIRAPALRILPNWMFASRLTRTRDLAFSIHSTDMDERLFEWLRHMLSYAPSLENFEFSISSPLEMCDPLDELAEDIDKLDLLFLRHLTLDMAITDSRILHSFVAPSLEYIRLRCLHDLRLRPSLPANHFPSLHMATVCAPGPVLSRFRALGLSTDQFIGTINEDLHGKHHYNAEVTAYIVKKDVDPPEAEEEQDVAMSVAEDANGDNEDEPVDE
ncbi:hypothetical protein V8E36_002717 [Tilletia maclaganii]